MKKKGKTIDKVTAFLGKETEFEGKIKFQGTLHINGRFKGQVESGDTLVIGESAHVEADVHVDSIFIGGEIHGNVVADGRLEVLSSGKIYGDIQAGVLTIQDGAVVEGSCRMGPRPGESATPKK